MNSAVVNPQIWFAIVSAATIWVSKVLFIIIIIIGQVFLMDELLFSHVQIDVLHVVLHPSLNVFVQTENVMAIPRKKKVHS